MPWDEIERRAGGWGKQRDREAWYASVNSSGIRIGIPAKHALAKAKQVRVYQGTENDRGWMLIVASEAIGRKVMQSKGKEGTAPFIQFSTLPGVTKETRLAPTVVKAVAVATDRVRIRLPWIVVESEEEGLRVPDQEMKTTERVPAPPPQPDPVVLPVTRSQPRPATEGRRPPDQRPVPDTLGVSRRMDPPEEKPVFSLGRGDAVGPVFKEGALPTVPAKAKHTPTTKWAPPRDRQAEEAEIARHVAEKGVLRPWTLEQAAEYVRGRDHECFIQVGAPGAWSETHWLETPQPVLDGVDVTPEYLFKVVNDYRKEKALTPVEMYVPPADKSVVVA